MVDAVLLVISQKRMKEKGHKEANSSSGTAHVNMGEYDEVFSMSKKSKEIII